jgi:hypothetical protein
MPKIYHNDYLLSRDNYPNKVMSLIIGHRYTWSEIVDETGADGVPPYFLLHRDGKVVAGCFRLDLNPEAPLVVLAGDSAQIREWTDIFCAQKGSIPVCLKSGMGEWLFDGNFKLVRASTDPAEIASHSALAQRSDVYKLLFLEKVAARA